jgi:hypothetical protein
MTESNRQIGNPNRYVLDEQGNIEYYNSLTLLLERADAGIDLAIGIAETEPSKLRPGTMASNLYAVQAELDDIGHLLREWWKAELSKFAGQSKNPEDPSDPWGHPDTWYNIAHARAAADLLLAYFQDLKLDAPLPEIRGDTVECVLYSIVRRLDDIEKAFDGLNSKQKKAG